MLRRHRERLSAPWMVPRVWGARAGSWGGGGSILRGSILRGSTLKASNPPALVSTLPGLQRPCRMLSAAFLRILKAISPVEDQIGIRQHWDLDNVCEHRPTCGVAHYRSVTSCSLITTPRPPSPSTPPPHPPPPWFAVRTWWVIRWLVLSRVGIAGSSMTTRSSVVNAFNEHLVNEHHFHMIGKSWKRKRINYIHT